MCVVVFGPWLSEISQQREEAGTVEQGGVAPVVIVNEDDEEQSGELAQDSAGSGSSTDSGGGTPGSEDIEPAEPVAAGTLTDGGEAAPAGESIETKEEHANAQAMLTQLIAENNAKIEKKEAELTEMNAMLDILTDMGDDPGRVELYKKLIEDTKNGIQETREQTARYEKELD
ncbi:MAG: hypothetical protein LBJ91_07375 [Clostridiales Family XIII bacterium]|nr:hypothetical protein [Clostridiales Family XIII bacterium]